jgi:hypothetical protein
VQTNGTALFMKYVYAALSVLGFSMPVVCFTNHFVYRGDSAWAEFFAAPFATWVIAGFSWDLILTATACTIWMAAESKRLQMKGFVWHFVAIFLVGICFALPTFLFRREYHLERTRPKLEAA